MAPEGACKAFRRETLLHNNTLVAVFIDKYLQNVYHYSTQRVFDFTPGMFSMLRKTNIGEGQGQSIFCMPKSRGNDDVYRA